MKRNLHLIGKRMGFGVRCLFFYFFLKKYCLPRTHRQNVGTGHALSLRSEG